MYLRKKCTIPGPMIFTKRQCCGPGTGSAWIRIDFGWLWGKRIKILIQVGTNDPQKKRKSEEMYCCEVL
jgi:hypothetical protein